MSNPLTSVSPFNGSAPGWTVSPPERYPGNGILVGNAGKNYHFNPLCEGTIDGSNPGYGYQKIGSGTFSVDSGQSPPYGTKCIKMVTAGAGSQEGVRIYSDKMGALTGAAEPIAAAVYVKGDGVLNVQTTVVYTDSSFQTVTTPIVPSGDWVRYFPPIYTLNPAKTLSQSHTDIRRQGTQAGTFYVACPQIERSPASTEFMAGSLGAGLSWDASANASPSTRAASAASRSPSGILIPSAGAIAFRATPTIETGVEEIWGEVGAKGSGTDHVRWGRDSSKHPFVEWSANDASYQRLTGSEALNALTAYDLYLGHSATTISLAVDAGTLQTGTRDAVSGSWGAGNIKLQATAGGVIYQPFATFSRTLSAKEIATLNSKTNWTRSTLSAGGMSTFQLRPY